jgi:hypothetical protein
MKAITAVQRDLPKVGTQGRKEPAVTGHHSTSRVEVHIFRADTQEKKPLSKGIYLNSRYGKGRSDIAEFLSGLNLVFVGSGSRKVKMTHKKCFFFMHPKLYMDSDLNSQKARIWVRIQ